jgi:DNA (cytosine-5)-methyltransferase 1
VNYLSVCSGIEAATVAWHHMGWKPVAFSEIDKFPSQVLNHHYPEVPNLGDMSKFEEWKLESINLLVGGTPCQSFSIAGLRKGLDDPRGNLMLTYGAIAKRFRPRWLVWENVPGVLSSNGGRDFGTFLGMLAELGYGFAYRVLDAQYFGVAQRRRRVFVVGCIGDWRSAAAVLFERYSLCGNPAPSREERKNSSKDIAKCLTARGAGAGNLDAETSNMIPAGVPDVMATLLSSTAGISRPGNAVTEHETYIPMAIGTDCYNWQITGSVAATMGTPGSSVNASGPTVMQPIAFNVDAMPDQMNFSTETSATLTTSQHSGIAQQMAVRRLLPIECERLQGFPDNYTNIKENCPDGPRYKALGNSMAVPVMKWIGERINKVENETNLSSC